MASGCSGPFDGVSDCWTTNALTSPFDWSLGSAVHEDVMVCDVTATTTPAPTTAAPTTAAATTAAATTAAPTTAAPTLGGLTTPAPTTAGEEDGILGGRRRRDGERYESYYMSHML